VSPVVKAFDFLVKHQTSYRIETKHYRRYLQRTLEEFFLRVAILPWDLEAAQQYGQLRATLERDGQTMGNLDVMISAHALALDVILVTNDRAFGRIKKLKVEDWTKAARPTS